LLQACMRHTKLLVEHQSLLGQHFPEVVRGCAIWVLAVLLFSLCLGSCTCRMRIGVVLFIGAGCSR
jgi:hypothetical protein